MRLDLFSFDQIEDLSLNTLLGTLHIHYVAALFKCSKPAWVLVFMEPAFVAPIM